MLKKILIVVLLALVVLAGFVAFNADRNSKQMRLLVDDTKSTLSKHFELTEVDPGDFKTIKMMHGLMTFDVEQYRIEGVGNLSIMTTNAVFMQMATVVITPSDKNLPLLSTDYMYILMNRKAYVEYYDLVEEKTAEYEGLLKELTAANEKFSELPDTHATSAWYDDLLTVTNYKATSCQDDEKLNELLVDNLKQYADCANRLAELPNEKKDAKRKITKEYTDNLISKGGISTNMFKDQLGEEATTRFFDEVFFGTEQG